MKIVASVRTCTVDISNARLEARRVIGRITAATTDMVTVTLTGRLDQTGEQRRRRRDRDLGHARAGLVRQRPCCGLVLMMHSTVAMLTVTNRRLAWLGLASILLVGCAAGNPQFTSDVPAGFWYGIWHGLISCVTLVIGIFNDRVRVYEVHNTGGWYDFGFLIGVTMLWGHRTITHRRKREVPDAEWEEISRKVEAKFKRKIRQWSDAEPDEDWNLVEQKAEAKLKRKVREWAERA